MKEGASAKLSTPRRIWKDHFIRDWDWDFPPAGLPCAARSSVGVGCLGAKSIDGIRFRADRAARSLFYGRVDTPWERWRTMDTP